MKRFIIFMIILLLTVLFIPLKTYAYSKSQLDVPITDLNNHTLREVFESTTPTLENKVMNGNFVNTSNWLTYRGLFSVSNNIGSFVGNVSSGDAFIYQNLSVNINDVIYVKVDLRTTDTSVTTIRLLWQSAKALINISNPIQNQWYSGSASIISTSSTPRYELGIRATETNGKTLQTKNALAFNLTASHGVTSTSGTAYDNAVAEIEWLLSKNNGYIQSVSNPFEIVDLTVSQMDYWYSVYLFNKEHEVIVSNDGLGSDLMNLLKGFINTLISLFDYMIYTKVTILGIEFSFLGLIGSGLIILILAFQIIWLVI